MRCAKCSRTTLLGCLACEHRQWQCPTSHITYDVWEQSDGLWGGRDADPESTRWFMNKNLDHDTVLTVFEDFFAKTPVVAQRLSDIIEAQTQGV